MPLGKFKIISTDICQHETSAPCFFVRDSNNRVARSKNYRKKISSSLYWCGGWSNQFCSQVSVDSPEQLLSSGSDRVKNSYNFNMPWQSEFEFKNWIRKERRRRKSAIRLCVVFNLGQRSLIMRKCCFCFAVLFAISYKHPKFAFAHNYNSNCRICGWIHYRPTSLGLNKGHFRSRFNWPTIGISHVKALLRELSISILINVLRYTVL